MIQRIQTVYLLLAAVAGLLCLCLPIGEYVAGGERVATVFNLWLAFDGGARTFAPWPLFAVLVLATALAAYAIFGYRNRRAQARLCAFAVLLVVGWYALFAVEALAVGCGVAGARFTPTWQCALPFCTLVALLFARNRILADEKLVRAADRIR